MRVCRRSTGERLSDRVIRSVSSVRAGASIERMRDRSGRPRRLVGRSGPGQVLHERPAQVDMTGQRIHFLAVHQDLHAHDRRQVHRQRIDDRVDRQQLRERAARMLRRQLRTEVDERVTRVGDEQRPQLRVRGNRLQQRACRSARPALPSTAAPDRPAPRRRPPRDRHPPAGCHPPRRRTASRESAASPRRARPRHSAFAPPGPPLPAPGVVVPAFLPNQSQPITSARAAPRNIARYTPSH